MPDQVPLSAAAQLPPWQQPKTLLFVLAVAMPLAFWVWSALLNNFVIEVGGFDGADIGWLHTIREIPGFLAVGVLAFLLFFHEQVFGLIALFVLGAATAVTAWFPSMAGILTVTLISSIGFHYFETVNQSLQLQWIPKADAPRVLGLLTAAGAGSALFAYGMILIATQVFNLSYNPIYMAGGGASMLIAMLCFIGYPRFRAANVQTKKMVLRRRYWLYYLLQFMAGARRQIFVVFAGFMLVERFGFEVHEMAWLLLVNLLLNTVLAPFAGRAVGYFGERSTLAFEYLGLVGVFLAYGGIYYFGWGLSLAILLFVLDHLFFSLALALKTYFQKIADPADIASSAAVAFTINPIAAVFLPVALGFFWLYSPAGVFVIAAAMAFASLVLALMIPRHPRSGCETIFSPEPAIS